MTETLTIQIPPCRGRVVRAIQEYDGPEEVVRLVIQPEAPALGAGERGARLKGTLDLLLPIEHGLRNWLGARVEITPNAPRGGSLVRELRPDPPQASPAAPLNLVERGEGGAAVIPSVFAPAGEPSSVDYRLTANAGVLSEWPLFPAAHPWTPIGSERAVSEAALRAEAPSYARVVPTASVLRVEDERERWERGPAGRARP